MRASSSARLSFRFVSYQISFASPWRCRLRLRFFGRRVPVRSERIHTTSLVIGETCREGCLLLLQIADQNVVALVVHHAIKLVSIVGDDADRVDGDVVDFPGAAILQQPVI